ncbi:MAG: hypothetical protein OXK79_02410 [Chloroflexota bacterium]|nr:hypothetical protein [Chloroflexota bacterium]
MAALGRVGAPGCTTIRGTRKARRGSPGVRDPDENRYEQLGLVRLTVTTPDLLGRSRDLALWSKQTLARTRGRDRGTGGAAAVNSELTTDGFSGTCVVVPNSAGGAPKGTELESKNAGVEQKWSGKFGQYPK